LHLLSQACSRPTPIGPFADATALGKLAFPMANELYPDLMHKRVNSAPFRMFWAPAADYGIGKWVGGCMLPMLALTCFFLLSCAGLSFGWPDAAIQFVAFMRWIASEVRGVGFFGALRVAYFVAALPTLVGAVIWLIHGFSGLMEPWRSERLRRKQLGLLFACLDGDRAGAESHYLHDDQVFARRAQRFLAEHHARYPVRLYDARGRYLFAGRPKIDVLVKALNYAVARGRDNELFVLLVDLVDLVDDMDLLIRAVRVAVARHHQVLVILPWQEDIPPPPAEMPADEDRIPRHKADRYQTGGLRAIAHQVQDDYIDAYHRAYFRLRRMFGKLGVLVMRANQEEPVQVVLDRLDRLRGVGRRK
jgi:hypothetical protein